MCAVSRLTCESCAAFNRAQRNGDVAGDGSSEAQCRRTAPPWSLVKSTDWCMAWTPQREKRVLPDDGA